MARSRRRSPSVKKTGGTTVITMPAASAAPVRRSRRRSSSPVRRKRGGHRRRRSGGGFLGGYSGAGYGSKMMGHGVGGFAVGFIEKSFGAKLPTLPFVGRKGAIAIAAYFLRGKHALIGDIGLAAAAISGYELGSSGQITGDVMGDGTLASQM